MIKKPNIKNLISVLSYLLIVLFSISMILIAFLWDNEKTTIPEINFSETKVLNTSNYKSLLRSIGNKEIETINFNWVVDTLEAHPYVEAVRVSRHYPSEINIEIVEREPIAIVNKRPIVLLDRNGIVLPNEPYLSSYNLPFMSNFNSDSLLYPPGKKLYPQSSGSVFHFYMGIKIDMLAFTTTYQN